MAQLFYVFVGRHFTEHTGNVHGDDCCCKLEARNRNPLIGGWMGEGGGGGGGNSRL